MNRPDGRARILFGAHGRPGPPHSVHDPQSQASGLRLSAAQHPESQNEHYENAMQRLETRFRPSSTGIPGNWATRLASTSAQRNGIPTSRKSWMNWIASWSACKPVKAYIRQLASLLLVARLREKIGLATERPTLHMCFTGHPGTGKTTVAMRMANDTAPPRLSAPRPSGGGDARRPGRPVRRPHRSEDQRDGEEGHGRRALHRRGVLPVPAGERARLRPGSDRDVAAGDGRTSARIWSSFWPGTRNGWKRSSSTTPVFVRAWRTTSAFPTTRWRS